MARVIRPYPTLKGTVALRVQAASVKGPDGDWEPLDVAVSADRTTALGSADTEGWTTARVRVSVTVPAKATAVGEAWSDVQVLALFTEGATNLRVTALLNAEGDGTEWVGDLDVLRADVFSRATLTVQVIGTVGGIPGRIIAEPTDDWIIDVHAGHPERSRTFAVRETAFSRSPLWLRNMAELPWSINAAGTRPEVRINTDTERLTELLDAQGNSPAGIVGGLLLAQLGEAMWTATFHAALGDLEFDEDDGSPLFPADWRGEALRDMLQTIMPDLAPGAALQEVHRRRTGDHGWAELQSRIQAAAQERAGLARAIGETVRALEKIEREESE
ncbi:hypothetical protein ACIBI4_21025 [Streptomyces sp. NPDC050418]|uniref:hypothetical protein n=1 Tax=Streptomyces sp. NPDC050418 TaxID=3365612 RepID=UPI0037B1BD57